MSNANQKNYASHIDLNSWLGWIERAKDVPALEPLYSAVPVEGPINLTKLKDKEVRSNVKHWARLIHKIAASRGLSLIGLEMAVLTDQRRQSPQSPVYFNSYVTMFSESAPALQHAYQACIERASNKSSYRFQSPIVLHKDLYKPKTGFFHVPIAGSHESSPIISNPNHDHTYVYGYQVEKHYKSRSKSVKKQLSDVSEILLAKANDLSVEHILSGGTLVLLPFARPEFSISSQVTIGKGYRGTPGGCLFFIIEGKITTNSEVLAGFLKDVRLVLAEASAAESQTAFESLSRRRGFTSAMLHGTLSSIRAIGSSTLAGMLVRGDADSNFFDSSDLAIEFDGTEEQRDISKQQLTMHLHQMIIAEDLAASLISFADMHSELGALRDKFQSKNQWDLSEAVNLSWKLALQRRGLSPNTKIVRGHKNQSQFNWVCPSGYIRQKLIMGVLYELFDNALEYGTSVVTEGGPQVSIYGTSNSVSVSITNKRKTGSTANQPSLSGFLSRIGMLLEEIEGLDLDTQEKNSAEFEAILKLSKIKILKPAKNGASEQEVDFAKPNREDL